MNIVTLSKRFGIKRSNWDFSIPLKVFQFPSKFEVGLSLPTLSLTNSGVLIVADYCEHDLILPFLVSDFLRERYPDKKQNLFIPYLPFARMDRAMGDDASNLVIGVGGILRNHSRDTLGFAIKATYVASNEGGREIFKDPVTDSKKKSHKGKMCVVRKFGVPNEYLTYDKIAPNDAYENVLRDVFVDGKIVIDRPSLDEIRARVKSHM